jgi:uncharacterized repeat protein (TIGR02543 family)
MKKLTLMTLSLAGLLLLGACKQTPATSVKSTTESTTQSTATQKSVSTLTVKSLPTKTEYFVGDTFDPTGCTITVKYSDSTTEDLALTDSKLSYTAPNTDTAGTKNVIVTMSGKRATLKITVKDATFDVTFDLNYSGAPTATIVMVKKGATIDKPTDPTRTNFTFDGWFTEANTANAYVFTTPITAAITLYAKWLDNSKTSYTFTFDYNFHLDKRDHGPKVQKQTQTIEEGGTATKITDPTFLGYDFGGWYTDQTTLTASFDFASKITANQTVYAKWTRNSQYKGENTFTLEGENVSLVGKSGPGLSGTATAAGMILSNLTSFGASNGKAVGYLYQQGIYLDFYFISDIACKADITLRLGIEIEDYTFTPANYQVQLNGTTLNYSNIVFTNVPSSTVDTPMYSQFNDFVIATQVDLVKGQNLVNLTTNNSDGITGTTMLAHAPLVDALKIKVTDAVIQWEGDKDLPANV